MSIKRIVSGFAVSLAVVVPSFAAATPATAATVACRSNHHGAYVCFHSAGDHFSLKDTAKDGYSAAVYWKTSYGRGGVCINRHGAGTTVDCNYNMRENWTVRFWAVDVNLSTNTYRYWSHERAATI